MSLKIFLALAVIDDLGAIMVIAIHTKLFYGLIFYALGNNANFICPKPHES
jgi:Na+/H+ antiporter NhaA